MPRKESYENLAILIECKPAGSYEALMKATESGLKQIEEKHYDTSLIGAGYSPILKYGIAFYKKDCNIVKGQ